VPVTICTREHDAYAQVAENQKRHGLSPLDLTRFIRGRVEAGESNAHVADRMGIDQSTVAHHLSLLTLPPLLKAAFDSGQCTSPKTLHELIKLHEAEPARVQALLADKRPISRAVVAELKLATDTESLASQALHLCDRLAKLIDRMGRPGAACTADERTSLRRRLNDLARRETGRGRTVRPLGAQPSFSAETRRPTHASLDDA
jgi:ParB family transcriptional regulator, chromosome partitioning protein